MDCTAELSKLPLLRSTVSISSMKMTVGASLRPSRKMAETVLSLSPTYLSMMLLALMFKKVAPDSIGCGCIVISINVEVR